MLSTSVIISAFFSLALGSVVPYHTVPYHGPPAPLNHDGTVALTPEVHHARAAHRAAFAEEFQRLHDADSLAAAHPDYTSPPDHGWKQEIYASGYPGASYSAGHELAHSTANYNLKSYSAGHYRHVPSYSSGHYGQGIPLSSANHNQKSYSSEHYSHVPSYSHRSSYSYNSEAHQPAPLNPDGTVAHTAAFKAIASNLDAEYAKAIHRLHHEDSHFQHKAAHNYHY